MINFAPFRTTRLNADFREISIAQAIRLANIPDSQNESAITELLRMATRPLPGTVLPDPALWSVQERMLGVGYYLAHVAEDGPDFSLGQARYSDYLIPDRDFPDPLFVSLGEVGGDTWSMRPLLGAEAEVIEASGSGLMHWITGAMAAQMVRDDSESVRPDAFVEPVRYATWLKERMETFQSYPESDFVLLMAQFDAGMTAITHFFDIEFMESGIVAAAKGGDGEVLPSARFPAYACITQISKNIGRKPREPGR